jgi:aldehyde dehydrogenase (NAD+)
LHLEASEKTPLTAIACQQIISEVLEKNQVPEGVFNLVIGEHLLGQPSPMIHELHWFRPRALPVWESK